MNLLKCFILYLSEHARVEINSRFFALVTLFQLRDSDLVNWLCKAWIIHWMVWLGRYTNFLLWSVVVEVDSRKQWHF
jgi:hypothetical protein